MRLKSSIYLLSTVAIMWAYQRICAY